VISFFKDSESDIEPKFCAFDVSDFRERACERESSFIY